MTRAKDIANIISDANFGGTLDVAGVLTGASLDISGNIDVDGITNLDVVDIDGAVDMASDLIVSGRVGVGISNPSAYDDGADKLVVGSTSGRSGITIVSSTSNDGSINFADGTSGTAQYMGYINYNQNTNTMKLATNAGTRLTIDNNGNVGIGTSSMTRFFNLNDTGANPNTAYFKSTNASGGAGLTAYNDSGQASIFQMNGGSYTALGGANTLNIGTITNNPVVFVENNTERMRIVGGRLLLGTTTEGEGNADDLTVANTGHCGITIRSGTSAEGSLLFSDGTSGADEYGGYVQYLHSSNALRFGSNAVERMRIDSGGSIQLGSTVNVNNSFLTINKLSNNIGKNGIAFCTSSTGVALSHCLFQNPNGVVGSIVTSGSGTSYATSSDYRLKENVVTDWDATTRLKQLKPSRFNFIADASTTVDGFLAHEVQSVVPEAIIGTKDALDADGNPDYQSIDQSKLVPLLVKTIQELEARITAGGL